MTRNRTERSTDRRKFVAALGASVVGLGCRLAGTTTPGQTNPRLSARPAGSSRTLSAGFARLRRGDTEIVAYVPQSSVGRPRVPLFVFLHGALRTVEFFVEGFRPLADDHGVMILAPYAVSGTWDAVRDTFGPDVRGIDTALGWAFAGLPVDPAHVVLAGFSDGASYTLSLGRANGDLFTRLVAFSPGFMVDVAEVGKPGIAISHGTQDDVLPYTNTRDGIVPSLRTRGYQVEFQSFAGGHAVLRSLAETEFRKMRP